MKSLKVKIITGFRKDQHYTIEADEAHKAYYLFLHPEQRGVFNNGVAVIGQDIRSIEPDYQATMGWNNTHQLDSDDWNEIHQSGIVPEIRSMLITARQVAQLALPEQMNQPLSQLMDRQEEAELLPETKSLTTKLKELL